jgi:phosphatidylglycerol:prolipoprotein diacylglycerol transferase
VINTYGLMVMAAFCAAFTLVHFRSRQIGFHPERLAPLYVAAAFGGLFGARILYAIAVTPSDFFANPLTVFSASGFAYYGGVIGGAAAVFGVAQLMGFNGWKLADVLAPATVLGLGVGRLGCFFAGCCHGALAPVEGGSPILPEGLLHGQLWAHGHFPFVTAEFHDGVGRLHDVLLYPTQVWSVTAGIALAAFLAWMWGHRRFDGQVVASMLIIEPIFRITIEIFRADHRGYVASWGVSASWSDWLPGMAQAGASLSQSSDEITIGLTTSQGIGVAMMSLGISIIAMRWNAGVGEETALSTEDPLWSEDGDLTNPKSSESE